MKKTIKGILLIGFLACFSTIQTSDFLSRLSEFVFDVHDFNIALRFFTKIVERIDEEQNGELLTNLQKNSSLSPDAQIDNMIKRTIPFMNDEEKRKACKVITKYIKENRNYDDLFTNELNNVKIIDVQLDQKDGHVLVVESIYPKQYKIRLDRLNDLESNEAYGLFYLMFRQKINTVEKLLDCQKCYSDFITKEQH